MKTLLKRFGQMLMILACLSFVLFGLLSAMPGDPVDLLITSNPRVKPEDVIRLKKLRGLDKPWYVRYVRWIWGYHDPKQAPVLQEKRIPAVALGENGQVTVSFDVSDAIKDDGGNLTYPQFLDAIREHDRTTADQVSATLERRAMNDEQRLIAAAEMLSRNHSAMYAKIRADIQQRALRSIDVQGLFGASAEGFRISKTFTNPGVFPIWFVVEDSDGFEVTGQVLAHIAPYQEPETAPGSKETVEDTAVDREKAGAAALKPTPALKEQARAVEKTMEVRAISLRVVDRPEDFEVPLSQFVYGIEDAQKESLTYRLLNQSPGAIDSQGVYRHIFSAPGQTMIRFEVVAPEGATARGAFSVEHGPVPDENSFQRGFIFALAGDREALGFSNTYKRPVWDILFGEEVVCGDGQISPGETCDDGNIIDGDGCESTCHLATMSFLERLDAKLAGMLLRSGRVMNTVFLMLPAILLSLLIAIPIGVLSAYRQYSWLDYIVNFFAFVGISLPVFWFGIMMLAVFSEHLHWFPAGGIQTPGFKGSFFEVLLDRLNYAFLPASVLSIAYTGRWLRYMRAAMLEVLPLDFVRTARAKGLGEHVVILKHALRNALIPVVTVLALSIPTLFGGALLTETVFSWPGIGRLQFDAVMNNDYYVAIVVFLISAALVMLGNFLADVLYVLVDPRIRKAG